MANQVTISYGSDLLRSSDVSETVTLNTAGNYLAHDVTVAYTLDGGGGVQEAPDNDVIFIDYDGFRLYSYTKTEFLALTAMPNNPTHAGMTAQGWNWDLADAQTYVTTHNRLTIGQMYIPDGNKTKIYITINTTKQVSAPVLGLSMAPTTTVDWGDGTVEPRGSATTFSHTYSASGDYVITINGEVSIPAGSTSGSLIIKPHTSGNRYVRSYLDCVKRIEIGSIGTIGNYAFYGMGELEYVTIPPLSSYVAPTYVFTNCYSLKAFVIPTRFGIGNYGCSECYNLKYVSGHKYFGGASGITANYAFNMCYSLERIEIPAGSPYNTGGNNFAECRSLKSVVVPSDCGNLSDRTFYNCYSLREIHFKSTTPPRTMGTSVFYNLPYDCTIFVPTGKVSTYSSASNYPSTSNYRYVEEA